MTQMNHRLSCQWCIWVYLFQVQKYGFESKSSICSDPVLCVHDWVFSQNGLLPMRPPFYQVKTILTNCMF